MLDFITDVLNLPSMTQEYLIIPTKVQRKDKPGKPETIASRIAHRMKHFSQKTDVSKGLADGQHQKCFFKSQNYKQTSRCPWPSYDFSISASFFSCSPFSYILLFLSVSFSFLDFGLICTVLS